MDCETGHYKKPYEEVDVVDHGLFIAGIVNEIAPDAKLSVYRVLDDRGTCDLHIVAEAVNDAIEAAREAGELLVLNLSLGFTLPPILVHKFLPDALTAWDKVHGWQAMVHAEFTRRRDPEVRSRENAVRNSRLVAAISALFDLSKEPHAIAVAAAGNDSCRNDTLLDTPPDEGVGPRLPALVEGVIGVSSVRPNPGGMRPVRLSHFSNNDDLIDPPDDGASAFGEDVAGLFSSEAYPDGTPNNSGWATWSGTSFATPIVSAIVARLMARNLRQAAIQPALCSEAVRTHLDITQA